MKCISYYFSETSEAMKKVSSVKPSKKKDSLQKVKREPVDATTVTLVRSSGSVERGGGPGGHYWHIQVANKRAGYVFINVIKDDFFDEHPSIQIHINQRERGKQIGRIAYRMACEQSGHEKVYAHMSKKNSASRRAAEEAGFKVIKNDRIIQLAMVWQQTPKTI